MQVSTSIGLRGDPTGLSYRDFGSFWASGEAANRGMNPYDAHSLTREVRAPGGAEAAVNLNPPFSVLLFQLLAWGDPAVMFRAWQIGSALLYAAVVVFLLRRLPTEDWWHRALLMLVWAPLWSTLDLAQIYVLLLALTTVAYLSMGRRPLLAGVCIGLLVAIKPQYLVWPALLLAAWYWRPSLAATATAAVISALPLVFGHGDWYPAWVDATRASNTLVFADNLSVLGLLTRAGVELGVGVALVAAGLVGLSAITAFKRWRPERVSAIALVAAVLAGPVSWVGYALLLTPVLLTTAVWSEPMILGGLLLVAPGVVLSSVRSGYMVYEVALLFLFWAILYGAGARSLTSSLTRYRDQRSASLNVPHD